jgi:hypothetical protein
MTSVDKVLIGMFVLCAVLLQFQPSATWLPVLFGLATVFTTIVRIGAYIYESKMRLRLEQ